MDERPTADTRGAPERATPEASPEPEAEATWRGILMGTDARFRWGRNVFKRLPSDPRCKLCASPFHGPAGFVLQRLGRAPWPKNPKYCAGCFTMLQATHGGAEIPCSVLFADIRGSTGIAERITPGAHRQGHHVVQFAVRPGVQLVGQDEGRG